MNSARLHALQQKNNSNKRNVTYPKTLSGSSERVSSFFGCNVFGLKQLEQCLPKPIFQDFQNQLDLGVALKKNIADAVAHAVKVWAIEKGATHFTHWFQPQTDSTAEKHDAFLTLNYKTVGARFDSYAMDTFSGSQLLQAEPDASSFPHGGVRTTFEARGYTVWDCRSPMFVQEGPHGTCVLYIPSVFISYNGEALDEKTVLLRSIEAVNTSTVRLLRLLGDESTKRTFVTLGTEQEFFLVDRNLYSLRPDLRLTGRTLLGAVPPKHQQLEDHYFGKIPSRVLATISECELELWKLGVPLKTRHNEVAPQQFEVAPIFEEASLAVDHNLLTMEVLHKVAHRNNLKVLFHEKPFKGVNGSGKHCNWSLCTDKGKNLLDPGSHPEKDPQFLLILLAILDAIHRNAGLLRAGISSASNEHRLGANEAPPGIMSAFLGEQLTEVLNCIEQNREIQSFSKPQMQAVKVGGAVLDVKVSTLPEIARDLTDRNRTSPFAFTGNKFEFRAVGSKQSPSFPVTLLNSMVASSINEMCDQLESKKGSKATLAQDDIWSVIRQYIVSTKLVRFEGDGYSAEWVKEAERRGLLNLKTAPDAFKQLLEGKHQKVLKDAEIFTEAELKSRYHVLLEKYGKDILIEARTLVCMLKESIIPGIFKYRKDLVESIKELESLKISAPEKEVLVFLSTETDEMMTRLKNLEKTIEEVAKIHDPEQFAHSASRLVSLMACIREKVDCLEQNVSDEVWPFPKYIELLF